MSNDINAVAIVHFVKHWDNNTKGYLELPAQDLEQATAEAKTYLINEAREDGVLLSQAADTDDFFTITKVKWDVPSNWLGV